jgi:protein-S-isoprenylcysteine O-methyltransferase Ste14
MWLVSRLSPAIEVNGVLKNRLAGGFALVAALFTVMGILAFRRARTTIDPIHIERASTLVTRGIYRLSRNPMYVALVLLLCAWTAFLASPWAVLGPLACAAFINRFQIRPEEAALLERFGEDYAVYCRRVRRWI